MKLKDGFVLRTVAGETVVLPNSAEQNIMISLNNTGTFLWKKLEQEQTVETLVEELLQTYDVSKETALASVNAFVAKLQENSFLEN